MTGGHNSIPTPRPRWREVIVLDVPEPGVAGQIDKYRLRGIGRKAHTYDPRNGVDVAVASMPNKDQLHLDLTIAADNPHWALIAGLSATRDALEGVVLPDERTLSECGLTLLKMQMMSRKELEAQLSQNPGAVAADILHKHNVTSAAFEVMCTFGEFDEAAAALLQELGKLA